MSIINRFIGIGRFGSDGTVRTSKNGNKMITVSFAENHFENGKVKTLWSNLYFDYNKYSAVLPRIVKGKEVFIDGSPIQTPYINKKGEAAIDIKVFVNRVQFCGGSNSNTENTSQDTSVVISKAVEDVKPQQVEEQSTVSDDLPF